MRNYTGTLGRLVSLPFIAVAYTARLKRVLYNA